VIFRKDRIKPHAHTECGKIHIGQFRVHRRLRQADIRPGALVDGPTVIETGVRFEIDNMEAISVTRSRSGETVLTLMSDNNFSAIQRTLLLQFTLKDN